MSTRAVITVKAGGESKDYPTRHLYAHGDGYPSGVGLLLHNFVSVSKSLGQGGKVKSKAFSGEGRYHKFSPRGRAYLGMENALSEPDQFMVGLISYLTSKGYGHLYLTDEDPAKNEKDTDIRWHYVVTLPGWGSAALPKVETHEYDYDSTSFKKKSASIPELAEQERAERRRSRAEYEKLEKELKKKKRGGSHSPNNFASPGLRGVRK